MSIQIVSETSTNESEDTALVAKLANARSHIEKELSARIVGQKEVISHLLITLFAGGHSLFVGVPGLAKTLLIHSLADVLDLEFNRIQFTPDLMPSDITGTDILEDDGNGKRSFRFVKGPVFSNILLADEINRTPPKTQAALLQAMQERRITAGGHTYPLSPPFHVFATQNPIEQEGTYPLPEAQLDRFMMMMNVDYPSHSEEEDVVRRTSTLASAKLTKVLNPEEIMQFQNLVLKVPVADSLIKEAVSIVRRTRPGEEGAPEAVKNFVAYGAGPRAGQHLVLAAKARAILDGRFAVDREDIRKLALPVLRHRVLTNFRAEAERIGADDLITQVLEAQ